MKKKILLVDDDPRNIFALSAVLKSRDFEVISRNSAQEALDFCASGESVSAILMDMMMPGMDGYEAIPLIRETPSGAGVLIVSVTAQAMVGDREKCLAAGADAYVSKPVDIDKLMHVFSTHDLS